MVKSIFELFKAPKLFSWTPVEATEAAWADGEAVRGGELGYVSTFLVDTSSIYKELYCEFKLVDLVA